MIKISKAKLVDCQKIRRLEQKVWRDRNITSVYEAATFIQHGYGFIAKDSNKIIGAIIAIKTKDNKIRVVDWFVDKKYQNKGIGIKLYSKLISNLKKYPIVTFVDDKDKKVI